VTTLRVLAALAAWAVLPGVAVAAVIATLGTRSDGRLRAETQAETQAETHLARVLVLGSAVWLFGAHLLARAEALTPTVVWALGAAAAAGSVTALAGPARNGLATMFGGAGRRCLALAGAVTAVAGAPVATVIVQGWDRLRQPTPWLYWHLARETAAAGGVPASSAEWGRRVAFLNDYPGFTSGTALLSLAGGDRHSLAAAGIVQLVAVAALGAGVFVFARAWGAGRLAAAAAVLGTFTLDVTVTKAVSLRPETLTYGIGFASAALARRWLEGRSPVDLVLGSLGLGVCFAVHPLAALVAAALWAGTMLAGLAGHRTRTAALACMAAPAAGWLAAIAVRGGGLAGPEKLATAPRLGAGGTDPTWVFRQVSLGAPSERPPLSIWDTAAAALRRGFLDRPWWWFALAAALVVAGLAGGAFRRTGRRAAVGYLLLLLGTVVAVGTVSAVTALGWDTYVPRRTGPWRLIAPLGMLVPIGAAVAAGTWSVGDARNPTTRAQRRAARRRAALVVGPLLLAVALLGAATVPGTQRFGNLAPRDDRIGALRALRLPPGSLVLANSYTDGFLRANLDTPGLVEGRAPYTEARLLRRAIHLLTEAQAFFADPTGPLPSGGRRRVTHVLVATDTSWNLGTPVVMPTDLGALDRRPDLRRLGAGPGFVLYRVTATAAPVRDPGVPR